MCVQKTCTVKFLTREDYITLTDMALHTPDVSERAKDTATKTNTYTDTGTETETQTQTQTKIQTQT